MNGYLTRIGILLLGLLGTMQGDASTYYFSSAGNDERSFSEARSSQTPWRSIEKLNLIFPELEPGDSVLFRSGDIFYGSISISQSGSHEAPIVIGAYGEGVPPRIIGFERIQDWKRVGGGIYESKALETESPVNMVTINGQVFAKGRYPNADEQNRGYLSIDSFANKTIYDEAFSNENDWHGAQMVIRSSHWTIERREILDQNSTSITFSENTEYEPREHFGYFIQDHVATLDQYGEWYFDPDSKKLLVYFGDNLPNDESWIYASTLDVLIRPDANHIVIENLQLKGANKYGIFHDGYGMQDLRIKNVEINYSGIDAVHVIGYADMLIQDCIILNSSNCGIKLLGHDPRSIIRNNIIRNTGLLPGMGGDGDGHYAALFTTSEGLIAELNKIENCGYVGIRFANENVLVKNNLINNFCLTLDDGGGIYTYDSKGVAAFDRKIVGNIVVNGMGAPEGTPSITGGAEGIYIDDNSSMIEISNNTVANCGNNGIFIHNSQDLLIKDNTVYNNTVQFCTIHDHHGDAIVGADISNNIFVSKKPSQWVAYFKSMTLDFAEIGEFVQNYYARPLDDSLTLMVEYLTSEGGRVNQPNTLADWQNKFSKDRGSQKSSKQFQPYEILGEKGGNQVGNTTFDEHIIGTWCWSSVTDCMTSWVASSILGEGGLEVAGNGPSYLGMNCGTITKFRNYALRFDAAATSQHNIEIFLQQSNWPWKRLSSSRAVKIDTVANHYEVLFSIPIDEQEASLQFGFDDEGVTYYFDNIEFVEVETDAVNPDEIIHFEYNATQDIVSIPLFGSYIDARGVVYEDTYQLRPFESKVLFAIDNFESDTTFEEPADSTNVTDTHHIGNSSLSAMGSPGTRGDDSSSAPGGNTNQSDPRVRRIPVEKQVDMQPTLQSIRIYPNPVAKLRSQLTFEFNAIERISLRLQVLDVNGRKVKESVVEVKTGLNRFPIELSSLANGTYFIFLPDTDVQIEKRVAPFVVY